MQMQDDGSCCQPDQCNNGCPSGECAGFSKLSSVMTPFFTPNPVDVSSTHLPQPSVQAPSFPPNPLLRPPISHTF